MRGVSFGLVAAGLAFGVWLGLGQRPNSVPTVPSTVEIAAAEPIRVHVAGWVMAPGVVEVPAGAIVADAIAAAGGFRQGAAVDRVNLAAPLGSGQQVIVHGPDGAGDLVDDELPLSINLASVDRLVDLPGVGPVLAERIANHRDEHGPFEVIEDLLDVPGIGEAKLSELRDFVRVP